RLVAPPAGGGVRAAGLLRLQGADPGGVPQLPRLLLHRARRAERPVRGVRPLGVARAGDPGRHRCDAGAIAALGPIRRLLSPSAEAAYEPGKRECHCEPRRAAPPARPAAPGADREMARAALRRGPELRPRTLDVPRLRPCR